MSLALAKSYGENTPPRFVEEQAEAPNVLCFTHGHLDTIQELKAWGHVSKTGQNSQVL